MQDIKTDNTVIDAQRVTDYESSRSFREAFSRIIDTAPTQITQRILTAAWLETELGPMIAIADAEGLYLLEFVGCRNLEREIERLKNTLKATIILGETSIIKCIKTEIAHYFSGKRLTFTTPVHVIGSPFQKSVWQALVKIPPGETCSYLAVAKSLHKPTACRAVARANGANQLAIVIPCHRVINANGNLGGYGGGVTRKQWLLDHEKKNKK